ncbi:hypothetical protein XH93_37455 [Bradyrhizobium sp. CCBAU 51753]|nr:hypothetical protein XH93_37455 [Bradyrhizobium sp. CCBAU 51753]
MIAAKTRPLAFDHALMPSPIRGQATRRQGAYRIKEAARLRKQEGRLLGLLDRVQLLDIP